MVLISTTTGPAPEKNGCGPRIVPGKPKITVPSGRISNSPSCGNALTIVDAAPRTVQQGLKRSGMSVVDVTIPNPTPGSKIMVGTNRFTKLPIRTTETKTLVGTPASNTNCIGKQVSS